MVNFRRVLAQSCLGLASISSVLAAQPATASEVPPFPVSAPAAPSVFSSPTYGLSAAELPLADPPARVPLVEVAQPNPARPGPVAAPTLADAVQMVKAGTPATMNADMRCLATAVYFESKGEPLDGQLAVAQVIMNRVASARFGDSVCDVVKAPKQFSFVRGGELQKPTNERQFGTARAIAWIAMNDAWNRIVGSATHFHALTVRPGWKLQRIAAIGNHIFYR